MTVFPSPDFSLCLHLLPPNILLPTQSANDSLSEAVQKLHVLSQQLEAGQYKEFWATLDSDDLYADLIADCSGFEELIRVRIAMATAQAAREVDRKVFESWINLEGEDFEQFVRNVCQWDIDEDGHVAIPVNNDNEAKTTVTRETVKFDRKFDISHQVYARVANVCECRILETCQARLRAACVNLFSVHTHAIFLDASLSFERYQKAKMWSKTKSGCFYLFLVTLSSMSV